MEAPGRSNLLLYTNFGDLRVKRVRKQGNDEVVFPDELAQILRLVVGNVQQDRRRVREPRCDRVRLETGKVNSCVAKLCFVSKVINLSVR